MGLQDRLQRQGPKKLLAIDGGGIRGVLSLEVLRKIEDILKEQSRHDGFRLADTDVHRAAAFHEVQPAAGLLANTRAGRAG